jgi:hypothetical protein
MTRTSLSGKRASELTGEANQGRVSERISRNRSIPSHSRFRYRWRLVASGEKANDEKTQERRRD